MKLVLRRIGTSLGVLALLACWGAVLLFNWSVTGWHALTVQTGSMHPAIPPGSLVLVHNVPYSSIKVGDVITYTNPRDLSKTITHRVVKTNEIKDNIPYVVTKGDANKVSDRPIGSGFIKGKAFIHIPYAGAALDWAKKPMGLLTLVYLPALILIIIEIRKLSEYFRRMRPYFAPNTVIRKATGKSLKLAHAFFLIFLIVGAMTIVALPVKALLTSNTVTLADNRITTAQQNTPTCPAGGNNTNVNVNVSGGGGNNYVIINNSNNQTATTGDATVSGNTNGGNATSGNASNCNSTNINISITNNP